MTENLRSEDYQRRADTLAGWPIKIVGYRIGATHYCHIDNVSPGATIADRIERAFLHLEQVPPERLPRRGTWITPQSPVDLTTAWIALQFVQRACQEEATAQR